MPMRIVLCRCRSRPGRLTRITSRAPAARSNSTARAARYSRFFKVRGERCLISSRAIGPCASGAITVDSVTRFCGRTSSSVINATPINRSTLLKNRLSRSPTRRPTAFGTPRADRSAVVVEAGDPRIAGRESLTLQPRRHAGLLEPAESGEVESRRRRRALARAGVRREPADEIVQVVIGQAAANLIVGIGQAAVQPQPGRLDRPGGEHDDVRLLGRQRAGASVPPRDAGGIRTIGLDAHREGVWDQRDRLPAGPTIGGERHRARSWCVSTASRAGCVATSSGSMQPCGQCPQNVQPLADGYASFFAIVRPPRRALRLKDRVLLRPVRGDR